MKLFILTIIIIGLIVTGCSNNTAKERLDITRKFPDGSSITVAYRGEIAQWLLAYFTKTKQIKGVSPLSSILVGAIDSEPDPNSIDALGGLIGETAKAIIK